MIRKINKNKFGVIEYAIDDEKDLQELPREDVDNTVYAIMKKGNKNLIYLYSKELKDYMLINGDLEGVNAELENIKKQIGHTTQLSIPRVFFEGDTNGMSKENEKILRMSYRGKTEKIDGFVKMKWQGSSTLSFPKKNFTIKMFKEETCENKLKYNFKNWGNQNKYCLKANYIDHTHARNIITARLWADIVNSREDYENLPIELRNSPNKGVIDGFPIKLYMNGKYQGLYTWNIPKDGWMFNMDEGVATHTILCAEKNNNGDTATTDRNILSCEFRALAEIDENDWSLEFPKQLNPNVKQSFNNLITCVKDSDDETFKNTISEYLDIQSAIDYYILMYYSCAVDNLAKNLIMFTYDGIKWYCNPYDLDNIWGSRGTNTFVNGDFQCPEGYYDNNSLLWQRLEKCFSKELYARYFKLRQRVLTYDNIINHFETFSDEITKDLYAEDVEVYNGIPYPNDNNIKQIINFLLSRTTYCDSQFMGFNSESGGSGGESGGEPGGSISPLNFDVDENNFADFLLSGEELSDTVIKYNKWSNSDTDSTYSYFAIPHGNTVLNTPTTNTTDISNYYSITNGDFSAVPESDIQTHSGNCVAFNDYQRGQTIIKIKKELIPTDDVEGLKKYLSTNFIFGKIKLNHTNTFTINMSNLKDVSTTWSDIVDSGNYYTFEKTITDQIPSNFTNNTKYYIPNFGMYHSHSFGMATFITSTCNILYYKNDYILQGKIRKELLPSVTNFKELQDFFNNNPMKVYY